MPRTDQITIHTEELQQIIELLQAKQAGSRYISIVSNGDRFFIRDNSEFLIGYITKKKETNESAG